MSEVQESGRSGPDRDIESNGVPRPPLSGNSRPTPTSDQLLHEIWEQWPTQLPEELLIRVEEYFAVKHSGLPRFTHDPPVSSKAVETVRYNRKLRERSYQYGKVTLDADAFDDLLEGATALLRHINAISEAVDEPHHLGFPVSGRTGTYDRTAVIVKRDWYDRLLALLRGTPQRTDPIDLPRPRPSMTDELPGSY